MQFIDKKNCNKVVVVRKNVIYGYKTANNKKLH